MKLCTKCETVKPYSEFGKETRKKDGYHPWCKKCRRAYLDEWRKKNPDKVKRSYDEFYARNRERVLAETKERRHRPENKIKNTAKNKAYVRKIKVEVLSHYSDGDTPYCACCGENTIEFLSIDHINGGGSKHAKEIRAYGWSMYLWLRRNSYPEGFQVLCMNCNFAKGRYGYCPHQQISPT